MKRRVQPKLYNTEHSNSFPGSITGNGWYKWLNHVVCSLFRLVFIPCLLSCLLFRLVDRLQWCLRRTSDRRVAKISGAKLASAKSANSRESKISKRISIGISILPSLRTGLSPLPGEKYLFLLGSRNQTRRSKELLGMESSNLILLIPHWANL